MQRFLRLRESYSARLFWLRISILGLPHGSSYPLVMHDFLAFQDTEPVIQVLDGVRAWTGQTLQVAVFRIEKGSSSSHEMAPNVLDLRQATRGEDRSCLLSLRYISRIQKHLGSC